MSTNTQPLNNAVNDGVAGLGPNANKTTLGYTGRANNMNTGTGIANPRMQGQNTGAGYGGTGNNAQTNAGQYGSQGIGETGLQEGPFGAGTGTEVRTNDAIAAPIDWEAINAPRTGGTAHYGLTGRAGGGGGIGQPANEDLSLANDQRFSAGGGNTHTGRHVAEGAAVGGATGHELNKHDEHTVGTSDHYLARDAAIGGVGAAGADHEYKRHEGDQTGGFQQQRFHNSGTRQNDDENTHPNAGRHGAEAGALAGVVEGHHEGHTVRDAALGGAVGGPAGHEVHRYNERNPGGNEDHLGQKQGLMTRVKEIFKPHHSNDPYILDANTSNANAGATGAGGGAVGASAGSY